MISYLALRPSGFQNIDTPVARQGSRTTPTGTVIFLRVDDAPVLGLRAPLGVVLVAGILLLPTAGTGFEDPGPGPNGTRVTGTIVGDVTWTLAGSPYWIESDVDIPAGSRLNIDAGVSVLVNQPYALWVGGLLDIRGNATAPVTVRPNGTPVLGWRAINVEQGQFSAAGLDVTNLTVHLNDSASPRLRDSRITTAWDQALHFQYVTDFIIENLTVSVISAPQNIIEGDAVADLLLRNFVVEGMAPGAAIALWGCSRCTVVDGRITTADPISSEGLAIDGDDAFVSNLTVEGQYSGIQIRGNRNTIDSNTLSRHSSSSIYLTGNQNWITHNTLTAPSSGSGISVRGGYNQVLGNRVLGPHQWFGIDVWRAPLDNNTNTVADNLVDSAGRGLRLESSFDEAWGNRLYANGIVGLVVKGNSNQVHDNELLGNAIGANVTGNSNRIDHNRFIDNGVQAEDPGLSNQWDDGYPSGGNWWSDVAGVDFYRGTAQDVPGGDGFGDTPYGIDPDSRDRYPYLTTPIPPPTRLTARIVAGVVELSWEPSPLLTGWYDVFTATTPTGFDFTTRWTLVPATETTVTDPTAPQQEGPRYYVVRAHNITTGANSDTSNTAGKWTIALDAGVHALSLPLAPYPWAACGRTGWTCTVGDLRASLAADSLSYLEGGAWRPVPGPGDPDRPLRTGEGYLASVSTAGLRTFVGLPGAMIRRNTVPFVPFAGFSDTEAKRVTATVEAGQVRLAWVQPAVVVPGNDTYRVYWSFTRAGFFGVEGADHFLVNGAPVPAPPGPIAEVTHAFPGGEAYYLVVPYRDGFFRGSSSYSVGVVGMDVNGSAAVGLPLRPYANGTYATLAGSDAFAAPGVLGFLWLDGGVWVPHFAAMPPGVYDALLEMGRAVQVQAIGPARLWFLGV